MARENGIFVHTTPELYIYYFIVASPIDPSSKGHPLAIYLKMYPLSKLQSLAYSLSVFFTGT